LYRSWEVLQGLIVQPTAHRRTPQQQPDITASAIPEEKQERSDELWVKYCFCHVVRETEGICDKLEMSPKERKAILAGQWNAYDWRADVTNNEPPAEYNAVLEKIWLGLKQQVEPSDNVTIFDLMIHRMASRVISEMVMEHGIDLSDFWKEVRRRIDKID